MMLFVCLFFLYSLQTGVKVVRERSREHRTVMLPPAGGEE